TVTTAEIERAKRKPVENLDAYDLFLRGMAKVYERSRESWNEAMRLFYRAMELDPAFATPYGVAIRGYGVRKAQHWIGYKDREQTEMRRLAARVSAIGQDDALALCNAGFTLVFVCREFDTGTAFLDQSLSINQNLAMAWTYRALVSSFNGQHEVAVEQAQ